MFSKGRIFSLSAFFSSYKSTLPRVSWMLNSSLQSDYLIFWTAFNNLSIFFQLFSTDFTINFRSFGLNSSISLQISSTNYLSLTMISNYFFFPILTKEISFDLKNTSLQSLNPVMKLHLSLFEIFDERSVKFNSTPEILPASFVFSSFFSLMILSTNCYISSSEKNEKEGRHSDILSQFCLIYHLGTLLFISV